MKPTFFIAMLYLGWFTISPTMAESTQNLDHSHAEYVDHGNRHETTDDHDNEDGRVHEDEHGHVHDEEQSTRIDETMSAKVGIKVKNAASQKLRQMIIVYGSLTTGPEQLSHVRARYSGLITSVQATIGDVVNEGDLLAEVESNESLKTYKMEAPISGTLIQRHANTGEVTRDQVLFSIANFDTLWAEFRIYPSQQALVKAGQRVHVEIDQWEMDGSIQHVVPALEKPYQLARVNFDNREKGLSPGLLVEGHIIVGEFTVDLAVDKMAIQTLGEQQGVFIQQGEAYHFAPLRLGRSDHRYTEVLSGLTPGQRYVTENSYLIKADIEKSEAEHEH